MLFNKNLLVLSLMIGLSNINVLAATPTQHQNSFMKMSKVDPYYQLIPNMQWSIVIANSEEEAFLSNDIITTGKSDVNGVINFNTSQRKIIYQNWQKTKGNIWLKYDKSIYVFSPSDNKGKTIIDIIYIGEGKAKEEVNHKLLNKELYTQVGFAQTNHAEEFKHWQKTFEQELNELTEKMRENYNYGKSLLEPENESSLNMIFNKSIEKSAKGLYLKKLIITGYYGTNRDVWTQGISFTRMINNENTKAIGYGGKLKIDNKEAEIFYMQFANLATFTEQDLKESIVMSSFQNLQLPQYGVATRNVWPSLIFTRNEKNELVIVGMSSEMLSIIGKIFNAQIS